MGIKEQWNMLKDNIDLGAAQVEHVIRKKMEERKESEDKPKDDVPWRQVIRRNANWYWIILLALVVGVLLSAKYWQGQCNEYIIENFLAVASPEIAEGVFNFSIK